MLRTYDLPSGAVRSVESDGSGFQANSPLDALKVSGLLTPLAEFCNVAMEQLQNLAHVPDQITLKMGIKIGLEGQIIVAKGKSEANFDVELTFKKDDA